MASTFGMKWRVASKSGYQVGSDASVSIFPYWASRTPVMWNVDGWLPNWWILLTWMIVGGTLLDFVGAFVCIGCALELHTQDTVPP